MVTVLPTDSWGNTTVVLDYTGHSLKKNQYVSTSSKVQLCKHSGGSRGGARRGPPTPLHLDQTEARRAEKIFFGGPPPPPPPPLISGSGWLAPPPLLEDLDPPLPLVICWPHFCTHEDKARFNCLIWSFWQLTFSSIWPFYYWDDQSKSARNIPNFFHEWLTNQ